MKRFIIVFCFFLLNSCHPNQESQHAPSQLLEKAIAYHDPNENWQRLKTRLYISSVDPAGNENTFEIEIDNNTGYFSHISRNDGKELVKGILSEEVFFLIDGEQNISEEDREKYDLTPESVQWLRDFYVYLYGLPMKLADDGTIVADTLIYQELNGKNYQIVQVNYDASVGKDTWFFYFDPETTAMKAYRFHHGKPNSGEYILLEEELTVDGVKLPKLRHWYLNKDNKYLGTDKLLKTEELNSYRI